MMTNYQNVNQNLDGSITDLSPDQQRSIHGGIYLKNRKGLVTIDDGDHTIINLPGYDLTALGEALVDAGVNVSQIFTIVNNH
jgi:hypothetical protein